MASSRHEFRLFEAEDLDIKRHLGGGGFGSVSLAIDKKTRYEVAVKELHDVSVEAEVIMKEARKMWKVITCPNLVHIMGITENPTDTSIGIVMEFLEYGDLFNFNRKFMMHDDCMARKTKMIYEIALGMNFLHNQNPPLIHRDLKLENVFVGQGLIVKIGDLGLALSAETLRSMQKKSKVGVSGTFTHFPPEAWSSSKAIPDKFWDIFTFAITVFELVSGENPWPEHGDSALVSVWVKGGERPDEDVIPTSVPSAIVELIKKCWAQEPSDRLHFHGRLITIL
ncbi:ankyrin repeat and protein kinase domain-containing protein 1-like [Amphiura filiformis]|uniref:ankyrin repeat and protein kinase domain-containing protein 1-like n=1 Tax=Amphiura filiformis TaxID=82378 RepID=UPI003B2198A4